MGETEPRAGGHGETERSAPCGSRFRCTICAARTDEV